MIGKVRATANRRFLRQENGDFGNRPLNRIGLNLFLRICLCALHSENSKGREWLEILFESARIRRETNSPLRQEAVPRRHFGW